jgi:hypothetical protein
MIEWEQTLQQDDRKPQSVVVGKCEGQRVLPAGSAGSKCTLSLPDSLVSHKGLPNKSWPSCELPLRRLV